MSIRFSIRNASTEAVKEGNEYVRFTGPVEPFRRKSDREVRKVGVDAAGNPRFLFTTGLEENRVQFYKWYDSEDEEQTKAAKEAILEQIRELRPIIIDAVGGEDIISPNNEYFWKDRRDVFNLIVTNETEKIYFDTKEPLHALLYLSIIGGAFMDLVAPTKEWADRFQIQHYLCLETEEGDYINDEGVTRSDAHFALGELKRDASPEALFTLGWCLLFDTTSFSGFNRSIPQKNLINYFIDYIDGKLASRGKKRNMPKLFLEYVNKWKGQQTREKVMTEAYVKAGQYFALINDRDKKLTTADGIVLGNTVDEAVKKLHTAKFQQDYAKLRDEVEKKWNS